MHNDRWCLYFVYLFDLDTVRQLLFAQHATENWFLLCKFCAWNSNDTHNAYYVLHRTYDTHSLIQWFSMFARRLSGLCVMIFPCTSFLHPLPCSHTSLSLLAPTFSRFFYWSLFWLSSRLLCPVLSHPLLPLSCLLHSLSLSSISIPSGFLVSIPFCSSTIVVANNSLLNYLHSINNNIDSLPVIV